ncbi:cytosolic sulfotransferase 17-like, partial [Jatropha curcas]|uniref:cytosolic sulfotransferase 17-like n=1 Tax=Jatropha curcas TaxID=180498 RepID=UPI001895B0D1
MNVSNLEELSKALIECQQIISDLPKETSWQNYFYYCKGRPKRPPQKSIVIYSCCLCFPVPYASLPKSIVKCSTCKIIYMCRDPKDVFVSLWHFISKHLETDVMSWEEAFDKFCTGFSGYGPFWDNILGYWKASLENPDKILFLKYEDLQNNTLFYVKRIAEFMGCPFSVEEERQGIVQKIVNFCSFESLSNLQVNKSNKISNEILLKVENNAFFRKGKIGDWENYLTPDMAKRLDQIIKNKFS